MRTRNLLSLAATASVATLLLLVFSFSLTTLVCVALVAVATVLWVRALHNRSAERSFERITLAEQDSPSGTLALERLFEATLNGMREGLLVVDRDMRVIASNESARRLFNSGEPKLALQRLTQVTRNPAIYSAFLDALQGTERSGVKVETFGPQRQAFDLRVVPLTSENGSETQGAIGVFFDVTKLERLERVRQEFLSNVSHELRTPLTAIIAFVETLESSHAEPRDKQRFLAIIRRNAERMNSLIGDILELSAIEAGTVKVEPRNIHLSPLVEDVFNALNAKAAPRGIELKHEVGSDTVVFADPARLEQMLTNLVENAIKFNRDGGGVHVRCENGEKSRILVEDTGEGIPAHHVERLFERFYRVDRARSRDLGGTGLGLAIVKHLSRAHGGEVTVESRIGEGSVFVIELPRPEKIGEHTLPHN